MKRNSNLQRLTDLQRISNTYKYLQRLEDLKSSEYLQRITDFQIFRLIEKLYSWKI